MLIDKIKKYSIILSSSSPRRQELLKGIGIDFKFEKNGCEDESFDSQLPLEDVSSYLAIKKSNAFSRELSNNEILITADTVVICDNKILGKPLNREDAFGMLKFLSGKKHIVSTGVCIRSYKKSTSFDVKTSVSFRNLSDNEINFYIENYRPYDKAGAYGAQEWIGFIAIENIEGSYFNVMGFPVHTLYLELEKFLD